MNDFVEKVLTSIGTNVFSIGQAGFIVKSSSGQLLAIDLYLSNCVERIEKSKGFKRLLPQILNPNDLHFDAVVCTHPHMDHFDIDAVPEIVAKGTKLYCSINCENLVHQLKMEYYDSQITYVRPGDCIIIGDFQISFVNCDHGDAAPDAVGVVVEVDNKKIYETGDTCLRLDRINEIPKELDMLIAPINGMYGNMDSKDAIELAEALEPSVTVPCHYGMFASHGGDLKTFFEMAEQKKISILLMQQGEGYRLA